MGRPGGVNGKNDSLPKKYALCCLSATAAETGMYKIKKRKRYQPDVSYHSIERKSNRNAIGSLKKY